MKTQFRILAALLALLIVLSLSISFAGLAQATSPTLTVLVRDQGPVPHTTVLITATDGAIYGRLTDDAGRAAFPLYPGVFTIDACGHRITVVLEDSRTVTVHCAFVLYVPMVNY